MADETKKQYESYLKWLLEELEYYSKYQKANLSDKIILAHKISHEHYDDDIREDELDDRMREFFDALEINTYTDEHSKERIVDVLLWFGWPNIRLRLETLWDTAELDYYRGGDHYTYKFFTREETDMLMALYDYNY